MHGYTAESLEMLKSEEGQKNAVFACFGSAAQYAQLMEIALSDFLVVCSRCATRYLDLEDLEKKEDKLRAMTTGQLLRMLNDRVKFDAQWVSDSLDHARKRRNWLMHHYFVERGEGLSTKQGRFEMLEELISIERELANAVAITNAMRIALTETLDGARGDTSEGATVFSMKLDVQGVQKKAL